MHRLILLLSILAAGCLDDAAVPLHDHRVVFVDTTGSCGWNLRLLDDAVVSDLQQTRRDSFLHSDFDRFNDQGRWVFGDTLQVTFEVIDRVPDDFPSAGRICNRHGGIPVRLLKVE
ncbi:MAG: hypothetical protein R3301_19615 [Saprospiraceae bacterium]|nr:hypothetical protein [Saprospiraceae bacterium]